MRIQIEAQRARYDREQRIAAKKAGQRAKEKAPQWKRMPPMMRPQD